MRELLILTTDYGLSDAVSSFLPPGWRLTAVSSAEDALIALQSRHHDLLLLSGRAEEMAGSAFLEIALDRVGLLPPVLYAGEPDPPPPERAILDRAGVGTLLRHPVSPVDIEQAMAGYLFPPVLPPMRLCELVASALRDAESRLVTFQVGGAPMGLLLGGGYIETILHPSFRELWRARLTVAGYTLPPPRAELVQDLLFLEAGLPLGDPALSELKRDAVTVVLNSIPGGAVYRMHDQRGVSRTPLLPVPLMPLLAGLVQRVPEEELDPLRDPAVLVQRRTAAQVQNLSLGPQEGYLLYQCERPVKVPHLLQAAPGGAGVTLRALYLLLLLGAVETTPSAGEPPLLNTIQEGVAREKRTVEAQASVIQSLSAAFDVRGKSPHEILGVPAGCAYDQVVEAYESFQRRFAPESLHPQVRTQYAKDLNFLRAKMGEAFLMLQSSQIDQRIRQRVVQETAEVHRIGEVKTEKQQVSEAHLKEATRLYACARELYEEGESYQCQQYLKLSLLHDPNSAEAHNLMGVLFSKSSNSRAKHMAEKEFLDAVRLDPWETAYLFDLADFYLQVKLPKRSRTYLDQALKIAPKSERGAELQKALRKME